MTAKDSPDAKTDAERQNAKAESDRRKEALARKEKELKATTRELRMHVANLDKLAKEHEEKLAKLKAGPTTPDTDAQIRRIEQKLSSYRVAKELHNAVEKMRASQTQPLNSGASKSSTANFKMTVEEMLTLKTIETQSILLSARIRVDELSVPMTMVGVLLGKPAKLPPARAAEVKKMETRIKALSATMQRLQLVYQQYGEASAMLTQVEQQFEQLKQLRGRDALRFVTENLRAPQVSGKLYYLSHLHVDFADDPDLSRLFPPPIEIELPANLPEPEPLSDTAKPKPKGSLMNLLGFLTKK